MEKEYAAEVVARPNRRKQKGVTIVEYAIMLALIAIAVAVATPSIKDAVINVFSKASSVIVK